MGQNLEVSFESIESAQQYIRLLCEAVSEGKCDIDREVKLAVDQMLDRRVEALRIVAYNLEKLERYLSASSRTLNDLRSLRRLLLEERPAAKDAKHLQHSDSVPVSSSVSPSSAVAQIQATAAAESAPNHHSVKKAAS